MNGISREPDSARSESPLGRARGEFEADGQTFRLPVVERDRAAENVEQAVSDDEAEFVHVRAALVRRVNVNRLEDARGVFERLALVLDLDTNALARGRGLDFDRAARGAATDGEGEEVVEDLPELALVRDDAAEFGRGRAVERRALLLREARDRRARLSQGLAQRELVQEDFGLPGFEPREVNELVEARLKLKARRLDDLAETPLRVGQLLLIEKNLRETEN